MSEIRKTQALGSASTDVVPSVKPQKVKRIKHELKVNPDFLSAIMDIKNQYRIGTTSAVIEKIFLHKPFTSNTAKDSLAGIRSKLQGHQKQSFKLFEYCMEGAKKPNSIQQLASVKKFLKFINKTSESDGRVAFFKEFKSIQAELRRIVEESTVFTKDDSEEKIAIMSAFNGDIDDNLPPRKNISFRLDEPLDKSYFAADRPKIGDSEYRRVLHQVLMKNTEFYVARTSREAVNYINDCSKSFNNELKKFNRLKKKKEPVDIHRLFLTILQFKKDLILYKN